MRSKEDVDGLENLMREHLQRRQNSDIANLLWAGYIAALAVEGHLSPEHYHRLSDNLKEIGREELREIIVGYPGQFD